MFFLNKSAKSSSIIYEGIRGVFILFYEEILHAKKKHKMQTSEIKHLRFRHFKRI